MADPITLDIPHDLGKDGVRRRIESRVDRLGDKIPGGAIVAHRWDGDTAHLSIAAMGQEVGARLTVFERHVHAEVNLPMLMRLFAGKVKDMLEREGPKLLK